MCTVDTGLQTGSESSIAKVQDLGAIETALAAHFQQLAESRNTGGGKHPVFALEHGLRTDERKALGAALRKWLAGRAPSNAHRLAWTVYATEIGYDFTGEEYWQTFEEKTPGWSILGDRDWIRECFRFFQETYGGIRPQGAWASHFTIICWPITHAVLPVDLQRDLARILFELRHHFSADFFSSPERLGSQISARSWSATPRFQYLAEDHQLVGQIATALLLSEHELGASLIHPETLRRIASDLEQQRQAREWLRRAREFAKDRRKTKGLGIPTASSTPPSRLQAARQEVAKLGLEPRLLVRPVDLEGTKWRIFLEVPNLSQLLDRFPEARDLLTNTRCIVTGSAERPLARGRVLYGVQHIPLARWPHQDEVLLQFERPHPEINFLLRTECLLRPGHMWLFEVAADRNAVERRSPRVRAGERYLIVREQGTFSPTAMTRPVQIDCHGIQAALLEVPAVLTEAAQAELRSLGLAMTKSLEVWPAGLAAAWWDGVGHAEWLAGECPCVAIRPDHQVRRIDVSLLGTNHAVSIATTDADQPVFLQLPDLPLGHHTLKVTTAEIGQATASDFGSLDFTFRVREALPRDRQTQNGALDLELEPRNPALEDLWDGKLSLTLKGPLRRSVKCHVTIVPREANAVPYKKTLLGMHFPVSPDNFREEFSRHLRAHPYTEKKYDSSRACVLEFDAGQFGKISFTCDRAFSALRWTITRHSQRYDLNLLNDTGAETPVRVSWLGFDQPTQEKKWEGKFPGAAPDSGGLFVAVVDKHTAAIVVPPLVQSFNDITGCAIGRMAAPRTSAHLLDLLRIHRLWFDAKLSGNFASTTRRSAVLRWIRLQMVAVLCGEPWRNLEANPPRPLLDALKRETCRRPEDAFIGQEITGHAQKYSGQLPQARVDFLCRMAPRSSRLAPRALSEPQVRELCELACRLLSHPESVTAWRGSDLPLALTRLIDELPTLCRAARLLVQATDPDPSGEYSFPGWKDL